MKRVMVTLILCIGIFMGCDYPFNNITYEGYIIEKRNDGGGHQILVVKDILKEDIEKITTEEIINQSIQATYFSVKEDKYKELEVGQKVIVTYNEGQPALESAPPQTGSIKVEVVDE